MTKPKIRVPKGWKQLARGTTIETGDMFELNSGWEPTNSEGLKAGYFVTNGKPTIYIRRINRQPK